MSLTTYCIVSNQPFVTYLFVQDIYDVKALQEQGTDLLDAEGKKFKKLTDFTNPNESDTNKGCSC